MAQSNLNFIQRRRVSLSEGNHSLRLSLVGIPPYVSLSPGFPKGVGFLGHPSRLLLAVGTDSAN
jgi:hypothetical protein